MYLPLKADPNLFFSCSIEGWEQTIGNVGWKKLFLPSRVFRSERNGISLATEVAVKKIREDNVLIKKDMLNLGRCCHCESC